MCIRDSSRDIFGVSILMTFVTTLLAPILLVPSFIRGGEGTRAGGRTRAFADTRSWDATPYTTFGTSFQRHRIWPHQTVQKWTLLFVRELESRGYEKLRGIVCPTGTVLTYKQREGTGLVSINREDIPGRSDVSIRLTSSTRDLDEMIARTDETYNREACVTFLGTQDHTE